MKRTTVKLSTAARLLGVSEASIREWVRRGLIRPIRDPLGGPAGLDAAGLLIARVLIILGDQLGAPYAGPAMAAYLNTLGAKQIDATIASGKTILVSAGKLMPPMLVSPATTLANDSGGTVQLIAIDIASAWQKILVALSGGEQEVVADNKQRALVS